MTITVHHLENSRSQRVLWMLEELPLPYEVIRYERDPKTMLAPASLQKIHPLGKAPVIEDGPVTVAETAAIVEYLVDKSGKLGPGTDPETIRRYRFWLHYAEGSVQPTLFVKLILSRVPLMGKLAMKRFQPMIETHLDFIEAELSQHPYFAGDTLTAADIMMSFPLEAAGKRGPIGNRPAIKAWLTGIHARDAYKAALRKGGPYAYA